ncbi:MAG: efflux transporter outer membrane subunit [Pirellula sp.]|nr:efflux transporter outer membrane subunit [Pirellula sp.]
MMSRFSKSWNGRIKRSSFAAVIAGATLIPGCKIPEICRPEAMRPLPQAYDRNNDPAQGIVSDENSACLGWREFFNDPTLHNLISESLSGNQELKILAQDIRIANNEYRARRGLLFPFASIGTSAGIEKSSRFTRNGAVEDQLQAAPGKGFPEPLPNFLVAADVSWEIDIWRKLRNARDAQALRFLGTQAGRNYVVTRVVAEVAENYYELLALDNRLETLNRTIEIQQQSLDTARALKDAARGTELAVQRFQAEVQKNQSEKLIIQQEITETENRINYLAGRFPQKVERPSVEFLSLYLPAIGVGFPSQQLLNRSDIRQAEREVAASGLDVRVARAQFFPSLILTAGVGYEAFNTKYLFSSPESLIYNAAGGLVAPLINRSAIKADYLNANARQLQAVYEYQQTVLNAHIEVINQLSLVENYTRSLEVKAQQLQSLEASVDNATKLFQNARGEYIEVLLAQRDMMEARLVLIDTKQKQLAGVIKAYQALGGGGRPGDFVVEELESLEAPVLDSAENQTIESTPIQIRTEMGKQVIGRSEGAPIAMVQEAQTATFDVQGSR